MGVTALGASGGLATCMLLGRHAAAAAGQTPAAATSPAAPEMTRVSYIVLAGMLALLVIGLGWCFYRALKAAGRNAGEQLPEGDN